MKQAKTKKAGAPADVQTSETETLVRAMKTCSKDDARAFMLKLKDPVLFEFAVVKGWVAYQGFGMWAGEPADPPAGAAPEPAPLELSHEAPRKSKRPAAAAETVRPAPAAVFTGELGL